MSAINQASIAKFIGLAEIKSIKSSEIVFVFSVIMIVMGMILPIPIWLLDALIAVNLSCSAFLIILVMQIRSSVSLSTFPTLLLITTLFRLALSLASTRLILLDADAGHIITAFGEVVIGGNIVVGIVVFIILTIVQFLVITKGSERVAEVGARFTLDAMPGKQMAIDIELRGGGITPEVAKMRRDMLAQESQFFGSMDGAMKFVKGDAIASIIIVITNMIAGICIGILQKGMSVGEAGHVYTVLTIGDGLVSQVPALILSLTSGLLVTRVAQSDDGDEEGGNVGSEVMAQLSAYPKVIYMASVSMMIFGFIPGMPTEIFAVIAGGLLVASFLSRHMKDKKAYSISHSVTAIQPDVKEFDIITPYVIQLKYPFPEGKPHHEYVNMAKTVKNSLAQEFGLLTPSLLVDFEEDTVLREVQIMHDEVYSFGIDVSKPMLSVFTAQVTEELQAKIDTDYIEVDYITSRERLWFSTHRLSPEELEGLNALSGDDYLKNTLRYFFLTTGPKYFGLQEASKILKWFGSKYPEIYKEFERVVSPTKFVEVIQKLLTEQVSVRNVKLIIEVLADWGARERDALLLAECVRMAISREIVQRYLDNGILHVITLSNEIEEVLRESVRQTSYGSYLAIDDRYSEMLTDQLMELLDGAKSMTPHCVIMCSKDIRPYFREFSSERFYDTPVLSYTEVSKNIKVKVLASVDIGEIPE